MRIHIQNRDGENRGYVVTPSMWADAAARNPDEAAHHAISIGSTEAEFAAAMRDAEFLLVQARLIRGLFPVEAPRLRAVMCPNAGLDSLAPYDWLPPGVALLNNAGTHADKAGEYSLMALLMLANHMPQNVTAQRAGEWQRRPGSILAGRAVTVVGLGSLGGAAARHARAFGMRVTGVRANPAPHPDCAEVIGFADIDAALTGTEFLLLACPLTPATRNLLDRRRLALLPRGAGVINIGRGGLVDEAALCDALDDGTLGGAILDVFAEEPLPAGNRLWTTRNAILTPHMSSDDPRFYMPNTLDILLRNAQAMREGREPPNRFGLERGY